MKFEDALTALRDGKCLYNTEFHSFLTIDKEKGLIDDCGVRYEFFADLLLSEKWNVVE